MSEPTEKKVHQGRNIKRFREMLGLKQEAFAAELGNDWTQRRVSLLEGKEEIEPELLEQVAKVLKVPAEAIRNFDEQAAVNIITSSITNHDNSSVFGHYHFNPIDKVIQLYDEKVALYERMLKDKNELIERLERMVAEKR